MEKLIKRVDMYVQIKQYGDRAENVKHSTLKKRDSPKKVTQMFIMCY